MVEAVSFPTKDGGAVHADVYGSGERGVVLAHGMRFDKGSWKVQATALAQEGFLVAAIDFRGYGKSRGEPESAKYLDVLAAGDSDYPDQILAKVGVNLSDPGFWNEGLAALESLIEQEEALAARVLSGK